MSDKAKQRQREVNRVAGVSHDKSVDELLAEARGTLADTSGRAAELDRRDREFDAEQAELQRLRQASNPMTAITNALDMAALPAALLPSPLAPVAGGYLALRGLQDAVEKPTAGNVGMAALGAVPFARPTMRLVKGAKAIGKAERYAPNVSGYVKGAEGVADEAIDAVRSIPQAERYAPSVSSYGDEAAEIIRRSPPPVSSVDDAAEGIASLTNRNMRRPGQSGGAIPEGAADKFGIREDKIARGMTETRYNEILSNTNPKHDLGMGPRANDAASRARVEAWEAAGRPREAVEPAPKIRPRTGREALVAAAKPSSLQAIDETAGVLSERSQRSLQALNQRDVAGFSGLPELSEGELARVAANIKRVTGK
jgi:hypothetical protein